MATLVENAAAVKAAAVAIDAAIVAKGGTTEGGLTRAAAAIAALPSGGGAVEAPSKDIDFYLPDGFRAYSYTLAEVASPDWHLPEVPDFHGLAKVGWNWTEAEIKACTDFADVGAEYCRADNKAEIRVYIEPNDENRKMRLNVTYFSAGCSIDWGDESDEVAITANGNYEHEYETPGEYAILLNCGTRLDLYSNSCVGLDKLAELYAKRIRSIVFSSKLRGILAYLNKAVYAEYVVMTGQTPDFYSQGNSLALPMIIVPRGTIPRSFGNICSSGNATVVANGDLDGDGSFSMFFGRDSNKAVRIAVLPKNSAGIPYICNNATLARRIAIRDGVSDFGSSCFQNCKCIEKIVFPATFNSIGATCFSGSSALELIDFRAVTDVVSLGGLNNTLTNMSPTYKIVVPDALYDEWIAATNWSDERIVSHIIKASEYVEV